MDEYFRCVCVWVCAFICLYVCVLAPEHIHNLLNRPVCYLQLALCCLAISPCSICYQVFSPSKRNLSSR